MPVLVAERGDIHEELKILELWSAHHVHLLIHGGAYHVVEHAREAVELFVTLCWGHRLVASLESEVHCGIEAWHVGETGTHAHPVLDNGSREVETYTISAEGYTEVEVLNYLIACLIAFAKRILCASDVRRHGNSRCDGDDFFHFTLLYNINN